MSEGHRSAHHGPRLPTRPVAQPSLQRHRVTEMEGLKSKRMHQQRRGSFQKGGICVRAPPDTTPPRPPPGRCRDSSRGGGLMKAPRPAARPLVLMHLVKTGVFITKTRRSEYETEMHVKLPLIFPGRSYMKACVFPPRSPLPHERKARTKVKSFRRIPPASAPAPRRLHGYPVGPSGQNQARGRSLPMDLGSEAL